MTDHGWHRFKERQPKLSLCHEDLTAHVLLLNSRFLIFFMTTEMEHGILHKRLLMQGNGYMVNKINSVKNDNNSNIFGLVD